MEEEEENGDLAGAAGVYKDGDAIRSWVLHHVNNCGSVVRQLR
jgi:hypothetical protein